MSAPSLSPFVPHCAYSLFIPAHAAPFNSRSVTARHGGVHFKEFFVILSEYFLMSNSRLHVTPARSPHNSSCHDVKGSRFLLLPFTGPHNLSLFHTAQCITLKILCSSLNRPRFVTLYCTTLLVTSIFHSSLRFSISIHLFPLTLTRAVLEIPDTPQIIQAGDSQEVTKHGNRQCDCSSPLFHPQTEMPERRKFLVSFPSNRQTAPDF